jgi:hypothetical protein
MSSAFGRIGALATAFLLGGGLVAACNGGKVVVLGLEPVGEGGTAAVTTSGEGGSTGGCPDALSECGGACVDTRFDPKNCGKCGQGCPANQLCSNGVCGVACGFGAEKCVDGMGLATCVDTLTSPSNCGGCGKACAAGELCLAGKCEVACGGGTVLCGSTCTNPKYDPANCGGCGMPCPSGFNTDSVCGDGKCGFQCKDTFGDCNLKMTDGCETPLLLSSEHCGACGNACTVEHGKAICDAGACKVATCDAGYANCDNDAKSCETNVNTDAKNCSACNKACNLGESCVGGVCTSLPASCRMVNGLKWCTNPNNTQGLNCNLTCGSVGMVPIPSNTVWYDAQDSFAECQAIRDAFGYNQAISINGYTYGCAELKPNEFICSNYTGCPQEHRTNSDGGDHQGICPCQ